MLKSWKGSSRDFVLVGFIIFIALFWSLILLLFLLLLEFIFIAIKIAF